MPQDIQNIRREHTSHLAGFERAETPATNAINSSSQLTGHPASVTDLQEYRLKKAHQTTAMEQAFLIPEALVETDSNYPYSDIAALPSLDTEAALILRAHFARKILLDLSKLKEECDI